MSTIRKGVNTFMKKRLTFLTAILLCVAMMFSFASCSTTGDDEDSSDVFTAATIPVNTNIPVSEGEIIAFYNDIMVNLQKADMFTAENKPGVNLSESLSANDIKVLALDTATGEATESDALNALNKSAKAIKDRIISGIATDSTVVGFGDMATPISTVVYPCDGTSNLTSDDVVKAECNVDGSNLNIEITLAGNVDTVNNIFGTRDKAEVLASFNENSKDYADISDYTVEYVEDAENNTYSTIKLVVEVEEQADGTYKCTGRIMSLNIKIICDVAANMACKGSFADYGDLQVQFRFTDEKNYEFDWLGSSTWEPAVEEETE